MVSHLGILGPISVEVGGVEHRRWALDAGWYGPGDGLGWMRHMLWSPLGAILTDGTGVLTDRREEAEEYEEYEAAMMISPRSG